MFFCFVLFLKCASKACMLEDVKVGVLRMQSF